MMDKCSIQKHSAFTGKEKDEETGYGYFGARYMDHELMTMWLSVDPMADKHPSLSPYNYCAWNPVKLIDPDGMDWYIPEGQSTPVYDEKVTANNCPKGATYIGKTAHWFGRSERDWNLYYYGDSDGNVTSTDMTITIKSESGSKPPSRAHRSWVEDIEYKIDHYFQNDFWYDVSRFEDKFEEVAQGIMTAGAAAMPIVNQVNSIYTLAKGEDIFGNKAKGVDFILAAAGILGNGMVFSQLEKIEKTGKVLGIVSTIGSSIRSGTGIKNKKEEKRERGRK